MTPGKAPEDLLAPWPRESAKVFVMDDTENECAATGHSPSCRVDPWPEAMVLTADELDGNQV
jgi:hypothetical protein